MEGMAIPKPRKLRRALIAALLVVLIGVVVVLNLRKPKHVEAVETVSVKRGSVSEKLTETGTIELVRSVDVKSTVSGEVYQLLAEEGDSVKEGQLLAVIEPDPSQTLQLYSKRAAIERLTLSLDELKREVERKQTLVDSRLLSSEEMEKAVGRLRQAENDHRLAVLELKTLEEKTSMAARDAGLSGGRGSGRASADRIRVLSPIDGIVMSRGAEVGETVVSGTVSTSLGTTLFQVGDPAHMIVKAGISEVDIGRLRAGQSVEIVADAYPDTTYPGRVSRISPAGKKPQGGTITEFDSEIEVIGQAAGLKPGMSCDVDIVFDRQDSVLYLPVEAVAEVFDSTIEKTKGLRGRLLVYRKAPASEARGKMPVSVGGAAVGRSDSFAAAARDSVKDRDTGPPTGGAPSSGRGFLSGLFGKGGGTSADSTFVETPVRIGLESTTRIEVVAGLKLGDLVAADAEGYRKRTGLVKNHPKASAKGEAGR